MADFPIADSNPFYVNMTSLVESWDDLESRLSKCVKMSVACYTSEILHNVLRQFGKDIVFYFVYRPRDGETGRLWVHFAVVVEIGKSLGVDLTPHISDLHYRVNQKIVNLCGPGVINASKISEISRRLTVLNRAIEKMESAQDDDHKIILKTFQIEHDFYSLELQAASEFIEAIHSRQNYSPISSR